MSEPINSDTDLYQPDNRGLENKYIVKRTDGADQLGGKHEGCDLFVLDLTHDPHAKTGILHYATAIRVNRPILYMQLMSKIGVPFEEPRHENDGRYCISFSDNAAWDEGWYDTEELAIRAIANIGSAPDATGMYILHGESWFPCTVGHGEKIVESMTDEWFETVESWVEPFIHQQITKDEISALHVELDQAITAILRKRLKPIITWEIASTKFITFDDAIQVVKDMDAAKEQESKP